MYAKQLKNGFWTVVENGKEFGRFQSRPNEYQMKEAIKKAKVRIPLRRTK